MTIGYSIDNVHSSISNGWHAHGKFPICKMEEKEKTGKKMRKKNKPTLALDRNE